MKNEAFAAVLIVASLASVSAQAGNLPSDKVEMVCMDDTQEYMVQYDDTRHRFMVKRDGGSVFYKVKTVEISDDRLVIKGKTNDGHSKFEADMGAKKSVRYFSEGFEKIHICR